MGFLFLFKSLSLPSPPSLSLSIPLPLSPSSFPASFPPSPSPCCVHMFWKPEVNVGIFLNISPLYLLRQDLTEPVVLRGFAVSTSRHPRAGIAKLNFAASFYSGTLLLEQTPERLLS